MAKFVPYEKLSKKKKRELDALRRGSWNGVNPVTRRSENPKAYNRKKARRWKDDFHHRALIFYHFICTGTHSSQNRPLSPFSK